ncbi:MAG: hypothetical protein AAFO07_11220 [Bacteroidota bacterium]
MNLSYLKYSTLMVILILFISNCSNIQKSPIELDAVKKASSTHVVNGVWLDVPEGFKKARTYDGFQNKHKNASISVKANLNTMEELRAAFDTERLKRSKTKLLEMRPVVYEGASDAFFSVVHDTRKNTIRYLLAIEKGILTYNVKAFCLAPNKEYHDPIIRAALLSTFIGEYEKKKELFSLAFLSEDGEKMIFTKDEQYPTESLDGSTIIVETNKKFGTQDHSKAIRNQLEEYTATAKCEVGTKQYGDTKNIFGTSFGEEKKAKISLFLDKELNATQVTFYGNQSSNMREFNEFLEKNFFKTVIQ